MAIRSSRETDGRGLGPVVTIDLCAMKAETGDAAPCLNEGGHYKRGPTGYKMTDSYSDTPAAKAPSASLGGWP